MAELRKAIESSNETSDCSAALVQDPAESCAPRSPGKATSSGTEFLPNLQIDLPKWLGIDNVIPIGAHGSKSKNVDLQPISKPEGLPDAWSHPPTKSLLGISLDGKCGITGVSNMLRLYGIEKNPAEIDKSEYRSVGPGMRADKFADNLTELSKQKFTSKTIENGEKPLDVLKQNLKDGKPVAIMYMTGSTEAHWVVVTGVKEGKDGPELTLQSWGGYRSVPFKNIQQNWARGYGGPYPYVVGEGSSRYLKKQN